VEHVVQELPSIREVAVIGVSDPVSGERVCAVAILRDDRDRLTLADVVSHCRAAGLMMQKTPEQFEVVTEFPRTALGKIDKVALRRRLETAG